MHDLGRDNLDDPKLGIKDIRAFLRGDDPTGELDKAVLGKLSMNEVKDYFDSKNKSLLSKAKYESKKKSLDYKDEVQHLKNKKHLIRLQEEDTNENIVELLKELEKAKEKDLRAEIDKEEIKAAMKDMDHTALTHADRVKRRELEKLSAERENLRIREQEMMDEIKDMESQMINKEKQFRQEADDARKQTNDDVFAVNEIKKKELDMAKERGDAVVKLQHKRQQLENERERIMDDLDRVKAGKDKDYRPKSGLSNAGEKIMQLKQEFDRAEIDPAMKDQLIAEQVRINHLREQQQKLKAEMMDMDSLDFLADEVNEKARNDYSKVAKNPTKPSAPASLPVPTNKFPYGFSQSMPPAKDSGEYMANDLEDLKNTYVKDGGKDKNFIQNVNDFNEFIQNRAPPSVKQNFGVENSATKVAEHPIAPAPGYPAPVAAGYVPPPAMGYQAGYGYPYPPPADPFAYNPSTQLLDSRLKEQELENKRLADELEKIRNDDTTFGEIAQKADQDVEMLKNQLMPNGVPAAGDEPFPEDFVFRQNDFRSEDLEVEERALMNVAAQEYDHLRLLSRLPVNSELYRYKMDQYKDLSTMRSEIEKVLQEQRLEKIRRDYEKQIYEEQRRIRHEKWMEEQKREIMGARLRNQAQQPKENPYDQYNYPNTQNTVDAYPAQDPGPQYDQPPTNQFPPKTAFPQTTAGGDDGEKVYDPKVGFLVFFDTISRVPRQHKKMQVVYGCYNNGRGLTDNKIVHYQDAETDPEQPDMNRIVYDIGQQNKNVQPHPSTNLVMEVQVPSDPKNMNGGADTSYAWTVINLFDYTYDFHVGEFKLPLYTGDTLADIDTRDINKLKPLEDTFMCIRLALPGDTIATSQFLPEKSTSEYRVPSIHQVQFTPDEEMPDEEEVPPMVMPMQNPNQPIRPNLNQKPAKQSKAPTVKDPFYRCSGINVFVHYVKQYPSQNSIKVGATLLEENNPVRIGYDQQECNWTSYPIDAGKVLVARWKNQDKSQPPGAPIIETAKDEDDQNIVGYKRPGYNEENEDILIPVNNEVVWEHDFYKMLWDSNLKNDLFLIVVLLESEVGLNRRVRGTTHEYSTIAYGTIKLNNPDGTIRFGTFDVPCYNPPAKIRNHDVDKKTKITIKVTVSQPLPKMAKEAPYQPKPLKPVPGGRNENPDPDLPSLAPPPNRPPEDAPFIENDRDQFTDEPFINKVDGIDYYIDYCRFLPENTSFTRITVHGYTKAGKSFMKPQILTADMVVSKSREPFYGFRNEIRGKMDPTSFLIFTIDTFDLSGGGPSTIGHAAVPLFLDGSTKAPCNNPKAKDPILMDGKYQLPIYSSFPENFKNFSHESFAKLLKVPCATILVRIQKARKDDNGKPISLEEIPLEKAVDMGVIDRPKPYNEAGFNTKFCPTSATELTIYEAKIKRSNPTIREIGEAIYVQSKGIKDDMTDEELKEWCENNVLDKPPIDIKQMRKRNYTDIRYASEYIPQLGFEAGIQFLHNPPNKGLYFVVISLVPPGSLYQSPDPTSGVADIHASSDVQVAYRPNFEGPLKASNFTDGIKSFFVSKPDPSGTIVFEVFEVGMNKTEITKITSVGFSICPLFQYVEVDGNIDTYEIYVNSGIYQLPVIKGAPDPDFIQSVTSTTNTAEFIEKNLEKGTISLIPKFSQIVKIFDKQLEEFVDQDSFSNTDTSYLPQKQIKTYKFDHQRDFVRNKSNPLKKILPKTMDPAEYEGLIYDEITKRYNS